MDPLFNLNQSNLRLSNSPLDDSLPIIPESENASPPSGSMPDNDPAHLINNYAVDLFSDQSRAAAGDLETLLNLPIDQLSTPISDLELAEMSSALENPNSLGSESQPQYVFSLDGTGTWIIMRSTYTDEGERKFSTTQTQREFLSIINDEENPLEIKYAMFLRTFLCTAGSEFVSLLDLFHSKCYNQMKMAAPDYIFFIEILLQNKRFIEFAEYLCLLATHRKYRISDLCKPLLERLAGCLSKYISIEAHPDYQKVRTVFELLDSYVIGGKGWQELGRKITGRLQWVTDQGPTHVKPQFSVADLGSEGMGNPQLKYKLDTVQKILTVNDGVSGWINKNKNICDIIKYKLKDDQCEFLNLLRSELSVNIKYSQINYQFGEDAHKFYAELLSSILSPSRRGGRNVCFIHILIHLYEFTELSLFITEQNYNQTTPALVSCKDQLETIAKNILNLIMNGKVYSYKLYQRINYLLDMFTHFGYNDNNTGVKWNELRRIIQTPLSDSHNELNQKYQFPMAELERVIPTNDNAALANVLPTVATIPPIAATSRLAPARVRKSVSSVIDTVAPPSSVKPNDGGTKASNDPMYMDTKMRSNGLIYTLIQTDTKSSIIREYPIKHSLSKRFLKLLLTDDDPSRKQEIIKEELCYGKMFESTLYGKILASVVKDSETKEDKFLVELLINSREFIDYANHIFKRKIFWFKYSYSLEHSLILVSKCLIQIMKDENKLNKVVCDKIAIIYNLFYSDIYVSGAWRQLGEALQQVQRDISLQPVSLQDMIARTVKMNMLQPLPQIFPSIPAPAKGETLKNPVSRSNTVISKPENSSAIAETFTLPAVDSEKRRRAFLDFIGLIGDPKQGYLKAMAIYEGDYCVYLHNFEQQKDFLAKLKKMISRYPLEERGVFKELFFHFGFRKYKRINEFSGYSYLLKTTGFNWKDGLSPGFSRHIMPAVFQYKTHQWNFLIKAGEASESILYTEKEDETVAAIVLAQDCDRAIALPFTMSITGSWSSENKGWNQYISGCHVDKNSLCLEFLKKHVDERLELNQNGTIHLNVNQLKKLEEVIKEQYGRDSFEIRVLPYAGKIPNILDGNIIEEDDIIPPSMAMPIDKPVVTERATPILRKRTGDTRDPVSFEQRVPEKQLKFGDGGGLPYQKHRKDDIVLKSFNLEGGVVAAKSAPGIKNGGDLIPIRKPSVPLKEDISEAQTFWDLSIRSIEMVAAKVRQSSAIVNGMALQPLEYPILGRLVDEGECTSTGITFPYTRMIKPYQTQTLAQINGLRRKGVIPLCSLYMGLGKTIVYMNMIAEAIAKMKEGITVILVPAALRSKTVEELYYWLAEAKSTAYLALRYHSKEAFTITWKKQLMEIAIDLEEKGAKSSGPLLLSKLQALMMVAGLVDLELLKQDAGAGYQGMMQRLKFALAVGANEFLSTISKIPGLRNKAIYLDAVSVDHAGELCLDEDATFGGLAQLANLSLSPRMSLSEEASKGLTVEECKRLIEFPMEEIYNPVGGDKTAALNSTDGILVLGYESLAQIQAVLFKKKHRLAIADEVSKYHSSSTALNKLMSEYAAILGGILYPFGASPFENSVSELLELLNISNTIIGPDGKSKTFAFAAPVVAALNTFQDLALKSVVDLMPAKDSELGSAIDLVKSAFLRSFAHHRSLSEVLGKMVLVKNLKDRSVLDDWEQQIPSSKKKVLRLGISDDNEILKTRVDDVLVDIYARYSNDQKTLTTQMLAASARLFGLYLDVDWSSDTISLKKNPKLIEVVDKIRDQLEAYKSDKTALNKHQYVRDFIEDPNIRDAVKNSKKLIVAIQFDLEGHVLKLVLEKHYEKTVVLFGQKDKEREDAIKSLKENDNVVLILPLKAGGTGLNLGFVDQMIIMEGAFNPALIKQMRARTRRVGWNGMRQYLLVTRANGHDDFVTCKARSKSKMWKFLSSSNLSLRDHAMLYAESLLYEALGHYSLRCREKVGYYTDTEGSERPVLEVQRGEGEEESVESVLRARLRSAINHLIDHEISEMVCQVSPKAFHVLNPSEWVRFPLPKTMRFEDISRIATYMANPANAKLSATFGPFCDFILHEKAFAKQASVIAMMKQTEDFRITDLRPHWSKQEAEQIEVYLPYEKGYKCIRECKIGEKISGAKVYRSKNALGQEEYELLIPKEMAERWAVEHKNNATIAPTPPVDGRRDLHPNQESWLRIPLRRGLDKANASKIAAYLADPSNSVRVPEALQRFCRWVVNTNDQTAIRNTFESVRNGLNIGIEEIVGAIPDGEDQQVSVFRFVNNGYRHLETSNANGVGPVGTLYQRTTEEHEILIPKETALAWITASLPKGIPNIGNSCYLNSALQFLLAIPGLQQRLTSGEDYPIVKSINGVLKHLGTPNMYQGMISLRQDLFDLNIYDKEASGEGLNKQQDPAQLIEHVLDALGHTFPTKMIRSVPGTDIRSENEQPMHLLQVPMVASETDLTMQQLCDRLFTSVDIDDPQNAWNVEGVLHRSYQERLQLLGTPPRHILMHFKRFTIGTPDAMSDGDIITSKIDTSITFSPSLQVDLSKAFNAPMNAQYKVIASLQHTGSIDEGHYKTFVKRAGAWYEVSDGVVKECPNIHRELESTYLVVLEKL